MVNIPRKTQEIDATLWDECPDYIIENQRPIILRGFISDWPMVKKGLISVQEADSYLRSFYNGKEVNAFKGSPENNGRYFYNDSFDGFNFDKARTNLNKVLDCLLEFYLKNDSPTFYVGSTTVDSILPGFRDENDINVNLSKDITVLMSLWIGNRSRIACHYDAPQNLACCVIGKRDFIMFPPEEIDNLYPGPLNPTPAGQTVSLVDFENPDYEKFPRFKNALKQAEIAELEPGDVLYLPSMWWHHVQSYSSYNILINYWWRSTPRYMGVAVNALNHAILSLRDLPDCEKQAWKAIFNYYIFGESNRPRDNIPEKALGYLADIDIASARELRGLLINKLNR